MQGLTILECVIVDMPQAGLSSLSCCRSAHCWLPARALLRSLAVADLREGETPDCPDLILLVVEKPQ